MENRITIILILLSGYCFGQANIVSDEATIGINRAISRAGMFSDAADMVDLVLLANELLADVDYLAQKYLLVQQRFNALEALMKDKHLTAYMSGPNGQNFILKVQYISMNVKLYGTAVHHLLVVIQRNLMAKQAAMKQREIIENANRDLRYAIEDANFDAAEKIAHDLAAAVGAGQVGMGADMSRVDRQIYEVKSKNSAVSKLKSTTETLEDAIDTVTDMNKELDKIYQDINLSYQGLLAIKTSNALLLINTTRQAVSKN